jgi:hypothetical protein
MVLVIRLHGVGASASIHVQALHNPTALQLHCSLLALQTL